jgi:hypothetical protein
LADLVLWLAALHSQHSSRPLFRSSITRVFSFFPTSTIASLAFRVFRRQARVLTRLLPVYRVPSFASARSSAESAPDNAAYDSRSVFHYLRPQRAPVASIMSSSDDDTPLVRGKTAGESTPRVALVYARHGYLPLTRRSPSSNSTLPILLTLNACLPSIPLSHSSCRKLTAQNG